MSRQAPLNRPKKQKNRQINDEAAQWYAVMEDDSRVADNLVSFNAWLDSDPRCQAAFQRLCTRRPLFFRSSVALVFGLLPRRLAATVAAGACLAIAFALWPGAELSVPSGQWRQNQPGDGSELQFGPGSEASLDFSAERRLVRLESGSVIVEAAKDPNRPLIVQTPYGSVRVVGTRFTVIVDANSAEVSVTRGEVRVTPANSPDAGLSVLPMQRAHISQTAVALGTGANVQPEEILEGWRTLSQAPLSDLTTALERETGRRVVLAPTPAVRAVSASGRFYVRNAEATLSQLVNAYGLHRTDAPFGVTVLY